MAADLIRDAYIGDGVVVENVAIEAVARELADVIKTAAYADNEAI